ncbi:Nucleoside diphosphate kinase A 2, partial [Nibea albiflora]
LLSVKMERTFIAVKPDGVQRGLCGEIIKRFEQRGFRLVAAKFVQVWEGQDIVKLGRMMLGETNPAESKPGSIRGDLCINIGRNIIHGSDTLANAKTEIDLWFKAEEFVNYTLAAQPWLYE